ncbi:hypothetical protein N9T19_00235 [Pseudomonadota bacterium]|jgi:hypothetical protein|nr:hypothetical protein [Pseudomonadota bacterium]
MHSNNKLLTFIGLFFLASVSLHSFAHTEDNLVEDKPLIECQSCHNEVSSNIEILPYVTQAIQRELTSFIVSKAFYPELKKPFNSQAPPKV